MNPLEKNAAWQKNPGDITVHKECKVRSLIPRIITENVQFDRDPTELQIRVRKGADDPTLSATEAIELFCDACLT